MQPLLGVAAALAASFLWAFSSPLLAAAVRRYDAAAINLYKSATTTVLFVVMAAVLLGVDVFGRSAGSLPWFALSGIVGLAVGDTAYFVSLRALGPSLALILYQTSAVFGLALGAAFRGEEPESAQLLGTVLVIGGVVVAVWAPRAAAGAADRRERLIGVAAGLVSALCQAAGLLVNQSAWDRAAAEGLPRGTAGGAALASAGRMGATAIALVATLALVGRLGVGTRPLREREGWRLAFVPSFLGTFLGILAMQVAVANLELGVASTLLATSPIFVIPVAWLLVRERPTLRRTAGAVVATVGAALVSLAAKE